MSSPLHAALLLLLLLLLLHQLADHPMMQLCTLRALLLCLATVDVLAFSVCMQRGSIW